FYSSDHPPDPHSFPTRRSSDLSAASKAAQSGPTQIVTADSAGNLATTTLANLGLASSGDLAAINGRLSGLSSRLDDLSARTGKRSEEHTSELQSRRDLVCRLLL